MPFSLNPAALAAASLLLLGASATAAEVPRYRLVDLGGSFDVNARALGNSGVVAGQSSGLPALYRDGQWQAIPDNDHIGIITALNRKGDATGTMSTPGYGSAGMVYRGGRRPPVRISNPSGGTDVAPTGINASLVVVGNADQTAGGVMQRCFRWEAGSSQDIGTLGTGDSCAANGIDDHGVIVGSSNVVAGGTNHAFIWQNGAFTDLGNFGGEGGTATAINRAGHVVGSGALPLQAGQFLAAQHAFLWTGGALQDLGTLGGASSNALAVNSQDTVIGVADDGSKTTGFLWVGGTMYALDSLVDDADGWEFATPSAINDSGTIIGFAWYQSYPHEVMLVPE